MICKYNLTNTSNTSLLVYRAPEPIVYLRMVTEIVVMRKFDDLDNLPVLNPHLGGMI